LKRRITTIAVAVVLAAFGTVLVLGYVHQANTRAVDGLRAVNVMVAQGAIPAGTQVGQAVRDGLLISQKMPASSVPADAVRSITPGLAGLVTSTALQPGLLLLRPTMVPSAQVTGGVAIPKGMVAVTIQICLPAAVAGYVTAGSHVAVFDTYGGKSLNEEATCDASHQVQPVGAVRTAVVLPRVEVLSVGPAPASGQGTSSGSTGAFSSGSASSALSQGAVMVTLAVQQADAQRLIELDEAGLPYLALLTPNSQTGVDSVPVPLFQP
jgi:pilus assembly protein CpaB